MFEETAFDIIERPVFRRELLEMRDPLTREPCYRMVEVPGYKQIINATTDQTLSIMSKDYVPIRDIDVMNQVLELFEVADIDVTPISHHITTSKDGVVGRTTFMVVELPQYTLGQGTHEEHRIRLVIPNSFNGTLQLKLSLMLWRQVCGNGAMGWANDFTIALKHRKGIMEKLAEALQLYLTEQIQICQEKITYLMAQNGAYDQVAAYLQNNRVLQGDRWSEKLMGRWLQEGTPVNFWQLYNIFTHEITHNYGKNFGPKISKLERLNSEVEFTWARLLRPH